MDKLILQKHTRLKSKAPEGTPNANPRIKIIKHKIQDGKIVDLPAYIQPHEILNIRSKQQLEDQLKIYSHPAPKMAGSGFIKSKKAMSHLIEWVFPALRWFCKVYGVKIPDWLHGHGWAEKMSVTTCNKLFGKEALEGYDWKEDTRYSGSRS